MFWGGFLQRFCREKYYFNGCRLLKQSGTMRFLRNFSQFGNRGKIRYLFWPVIQFNVDTASQIPQFWRASYMLSLMLPLKDTVAKDLQIPTPHLYAWTDSTIVLGWLNNSAGNWKIFVSNRISQGLSVIPSSQ